MQMIVQMQQQQPAVAALAAGGAAAPAGMPPQYICLDDTRQFLTDARAFRRANRYLGRDRLLLDARFQIEQTQ
jgi:hypothetical protein